MIIDTGTPPLTRFSYSTYFSLTRLDIPISMISGICIRLLLAENGYSKNDKIIIFISGHIH